MSGWSGVNTTSTARGLIRYEAEVWHKKLSKYQTFRGHDSYVVEQKALAKMAQWDEIWARAQELGDKKRLADQRTADSQEALAACEHLLEHALSAASAVEWESLKDHSEFPEPVPASPDPPQIPREPQPSDDEYAITFGFLDKLLRSRREEKGKLAEERFRRAHKQWEKQKDEGIASHDAKNQDHQAAVEAWQEKRAEYLKKREEGNAAIENKRLRYSAKDPQAVLDYCDLVLSSSEYPGRFPQSCELDYNPQNGLLTVDYQLPFTDCIPTLKEVSYVRSRGELVEKRIPQSELNKLYDSVLYQIALRTVHELYAADQVEALLSVVFNGYVRSTDPATGQETNACVLSLQAGRDEFSQINLAAVEPKACFKKLKGVGSSKLHSLTPIAPILKIDRVDSRFVASYAVADNIDDRDNLAAMDWQDFENLVRELFDEEFAGSAGEVKITRASRDGGVDAVAFDPDPLRGGKIVIQAKRYTNTVGVSAVRDLYGTVVNEGANSGILVTTSDYGPDAYEFAKGKPLKLLNGGNLLSLLEKHGHRARIDLKEARRTLAEENTA